MPEPVTNNAVAGAYLNGVFHLYSFMGLDSTKIWSGIHKRGFRYNTVTGVWDTIPPVPNTLSRIAAGASTVNNKIYIIGGYTVTQTGSEFSSKFIFIYDPDSNSYSQGTDLLIATDDHVQCVWRDSLIYIITGWSNSGNIPNVQIYDPANDTVLVGTPTPNNNDYKAFGASGVIIGDTIYYGGGARDIGNFEIQPKLRIGTINPNSPDSITWSFSTDSAVNIYRSAAAVFDDLSGGGPLHPIWIGGSGNSYNYNGIEYGTGNGVNPLDNIILFDRDSGQFSQVANIGLNIMDLRGIVHLEGGNRYIIAGGMDTGQVVSNKTYLIQYIVLLDISERSLNPLDLTVFPNPATAYIALTSTSLADNSRWSIYSSTGELMNVGQTSENTTKINTQHYSSGIYLIMVKTENGIAEKKFIVAK